MTRGISKAVAYFSRTGIFSLTDITLLLIDETGFCFGNNFA